MEQNNAPKPVATFIGYLEGISPSIEWLGDEMPVGTQFYAMPTPVLDRAPVISELPAGSVEAERAKRLIPLLKSFRDRLCNDDRSALMFEGDVDTLLETISLLKRAALDSRAQPVAPRPTDDELWDQTIRDRDTYHEWADKLAEAISKHFGTYIGEHSNTNCPWAEALEAIDSAQPVAAGELPTDISRRLREEADKPSHDRLVSLNTTVQRELLVQAADEIERYYGGMMAWKQTAEKKDADYNNERMERINERCKARADSRPAGGATDRDALIEAVSDFRKATYEFARGQDPSDHALMMEAQKRIFDVAIAEPAATLAASVAPDQAGFEAWANWHGGLPLDRANDQQCEEGFFLFPTYKHHHTEIAWRAWANKPAASVAQPGAEQVHLHDVKGEWAVCESNDVGAVMFVSARSLIVAAAVPDDVAKDAARWRAFRSRDECTDLEYSDFKDQFRTDADELIDQYIDDPATPTTGEG